MIQSQLSCLTECRKKRAYVSILVENDVALWFVYPVTQDVTRSKSIIENVVNKSILLDIC